MPFRASVLTLQKGFNQALELAATEKVYLQAWSTALAGNITSVYALEILSNLSRAIATLNTIKTLPGLQAYAQNQFGDGLYDVGTEFTAMVNALVAVENWLKANIPSNSVSIVNGVLSGNTYTPAQTAALKSLVVAAIATIS